MKIPRSFWVCFLRRQSNKSSHNNKIAKLVANPAKKYTSGSEDTGTITSKPSSPSNLVHRPGVKPAVTRTVVGVRAVKWTFPPTGVGISVQGEQAQGVGALEVGWAEGPGELGARDGARELGAREGAVVTTNVLGDIVGPPVVGEGLGEEVGC